MDTVALGIGVVLVSLIPIILIIYSIYHVIFAVIELHRFIEQLDRSIYRKGIFLLGPLLLASDKFNNKEGNHAKNKFFSHIKKFAISAFFIVVILTIAKVAAGGFVLYPSKPNTNMLTNVYAK